MDDDLFGGLPAVSKTENGGSGGTTAKKCAAAVPQKAEVNVTSKPAFVGGGEKRAEKRKSGTSLVSSLGTAGTTMAFLPQAVRKKKKPSKPQRIIKRYIVTENKAIPESGFQTKNNRTHDNDAIKTPAAPLQIYVGTSRIKSDLNSESETRDVNDTDQSNNLNHQGDITESNSEPYLENEPESLRLLHASALTNNPYDPHCPNDYLAYRERKKTEQVRRDLQRSALQRLDAQEKLRKKIEEERRKMLESGELDKLVESHAGVGGVASGGMAGGAAGSGASSTGRGRGRGVANLPAWLVRKQQEQKQAKNSDAKPISDGQFDDSG